jgi:acyl-CoA thioester hydrolase
MTAAVPFAHEVRVYWEDTDAGGVVFYANYLKYFERARTEWLRAAGFGQQQLRDEFGVQFMVLETALRHHAPARLDDTLRIGVAPLGAPRGARIAIAQDAWRGATRVCDGRIELACVDARSHEGTLRARRIPKPILEALFEAPPS